MPKICNRKPVDKRKPSRAAQMTALEKEIMKPGGLWAQEVKLDWGYKCAWPGCNKKAQAAHHFFHKAQGNRAKYSTGNGVALCYGHHIGKVHRGGEVEPIREVLIAKIGEQNFRCLKIQCAEYWNPTLEELRAMKEIMIARLSGAAF